jgi:hypothetical protein
LENLGIEGRILLKRIFKMWDGEAWNGLIWLRIGTCAGHFVNMVMNPQVPKVQVIS